MEKRGRGGGVTGCEGGVGGGGGREGGGSILKGGRCKEGEGGA